MVLSSIFIPVSLKFSSWSLRSLIKHLSLVPSRKQKVVLRGTKNCFFVFTIKMTDHKEINKDDITDNLNIMKVKFIFLILY